MDQVGSTPVSGYSGEYVTDTSWERSMLSTMENGIMDLMKLSQSEITDICYGKPKLSKEQRQQIRDNIENEIAKYQTTKGFRLPAVVTRKYNGTMFIYDAARYSIVKISKSMNSKTILNTKYIKDLRPQPVSGVIEISKEHFFDKSGQMKRVQRNDTFTFITTNKERFLMPNKSYEVLLIYWSMPITGHVLDSVSSSGGPAYANKTLKVYVNSGETYYSMRTKDEVATEAKAQYAKTVEGSRAVQLSADKELFKDCDFLASLKTDASVNLKIAEQQAASVAPAEQSNPKKWYRKLEYNGTYRSDWKYVSSGKEMCQGARALSAIRMLALREGLKCGLPTSATGIKCTSISCGGTAVAYAYDITEGVFRYICNKCLNDRNAWRYIYVTKKSPGISDLKFIEYAPYKSMSHLRAAFFNNLCENPKANVNAEDLEKGSFRLVTATRYPHNIIVSKDGVNHEVEIFSQLPPIVELMEAYAIRNTPDIIGAINAKLGLTSTPPFIDGPDSSATQFDRVSARVDERYADNVDAVMDKLAGLPILYQVDENVFENKDLRITMHPDNSYEIESLSNNNAKTANDNTSGTNFFNETVAQGNESTDNNSLDEKIGSFNQIAGVIRRALKLDTLCESKGLNPELLSKAMLVYLVDSAFKEIALPDPSYKYVQKMIVDDILNYIGMVNKAKEIFLNASSEVHQQYIDAHLMDLLNR